MTPGITDPTRVSPEAIGVGPNKPVHVPQVTWSSPATNRLLLDAGFGGAYYGYGHRERDGNLTRDLIRVTEQCTAGCAANGAFRAWCIARRIGLTRGRARTRGARRPRMSPAGTV